MVTKNWSGGVFTLTVQHNGPLDITRTPGAIEYHMGNYSLAERTGGRFRDTRALLDAARAGDASAATFWDQSVKALAAHLVGVMAARAASVKPVWALRYE